MRHIFADILHFCHNLLCFSRKKGIRKAFPQVVHGQWRRMQHIIGIKPVIAQFVKYYLVSRKVENLLRKQLLQAVDCKQQGRFTKLIGMHSVTNMPDRADCKENLQIRITCRHTGNQ